MQLEELMLQSGIAVWDSTRTSRKGNLVLTGSWYHYSDPHGESTTGYAYEGYLWAVVDPQTNRVLDSHYEEDSWTY